MSYNCLVLRVQTNRGAKRKGSKEFVCAILLAGICSKDYNKASSPIAYQAILHEFNICELVRCRCGAWKSVGA